ncbi:MAG: HlyD family secretion protein, partial [Myxococcaceae bacterium]
EVKAARAGVVAENVVPDGQWVEKGAVLARLDGTEPKKKLEANASRTAALQAKAKKPSPAAKKAAVAQAKQAKADAELQKAVVKFEALVSKAKKKRTAAVVKAEKKLASLKAAAVRAGKAAEAAAAASGARALEAELAKLAEEKKTLEAELASLDVVAPEAGFLSGSARVKQTLAAGAVFGRLEDTKVLKAVAFFAEGDREFIKLDQPVSLTLAKGKELQAKVASIGAAAQETPGAQGRFYEVTATVENADAALKPGSQGTAKLEGGSRSLFGRVF